MGGQGGVSLGAWRPKSNQGAPGNAPGAKTDCDVTSKAHFHLGAVTDLGFVTNALVRMRPGNALRAGGRLVMAFRPVDAETPVNHAREMRDTVIKSGLSGVAATVLAVTVWSPAGLGGMIGTSLASGTDSTSTTANTVGRLAPFPAPITEVELRDIQAKLRDSQASLRTLRAATNDEIAHIRAIARRSGLAASMGLRGPIGSGMDVTDALIAPAPLVAPAPIVAQSAAPEAAPAETVAAAALSPITVSYDAPAAQRGGAVVTYIGGDEYNDAPDPNMELASLLLAY
jgi:hypothetical protein